MDVNFLAMLLDKIPKKPQNATMSAISASTTLFRADSHQYGVCEANSKLNAVGVQHNRQILHTS
jgi:hypothetical protein